MLFRSDLQSDLGDVKIISTATEHLDLTAISTLPLSLNIAGKAYDIDGNLIEGISITTDQIILAGNQDGTEKETLIRLSLKFEKNTFNLLDRIDLNVNGEIKQNERSKQLNARQYLKFVNMRFKLDGKATIDFN